MPQTVTVSLPNAPAVVNQTLIPSAAYSPGDLVVVTSAFPVGNFRKAEITVVGGSLSGNLDVYVQRQLADGATWDSIAHFAQLGASTPNAVRTLGFVEGTANLENSNSQSIAANTVLAVTMGGYWRIFAGMSATGQTFAVYGTFWQ